VPVKANQARVKTLWKRSFEVIQNWEYQGNSGIHGSTHQCHFQMVQTARLTELPSQFINL